MTRTLGWAAVLLAAVQVMGLGALYAWSVLIEPVQTHFGIDRTGTGMVFSISIFVFTLGVMAAPRLCAAWRLSAVGAGACFVGATGLTGAALAPGFWTFVATYAGLFAAASGVGYAAGLQMAVMSGVARPGLATGVIVAAFALGAVVLGPVMGQISASNTLAAALFLPAGLLAAIGVLSVGAQRAFSGLNACFPAQRAAKEARQHRDSTAGSGIVWLLWCGFATGAAGGLMALGHAAAIVTDQGGTVAMAGVSVSMIAAGNALGRITSGAISDRLGPRIVLLIAALTLALATGLMSLALNTAISVCALAIAGFAYGAMATGYPVAVNRIFGADRFSSVYGRVFTAWGIAGLIAPFLAGWLFDRTGSYQFALQLATLAAVLSAVIVSRLPLTLRRNQID